MRHTLYIVALLTMLCLLSSCRAGVNPLEPDQMATYYGNRVSMKWLQAFKTVHCITTLNPHNGQPVDDITCFDTQEEVFQEVERRNQREANGD